MEEDNVERVYPDNVEVYGNDGELTEEQQKVRDELRKERLNRSLVAYNMPEDKFTAPQEYTEESVNKVDGLVKYIDGLDLEDELKENIKTHALGVFLSNPKNVVKKVVVGKLKDNYTAANLSQFTIDLEADNVDDCISNHINGAFREFKFRNEQHKAETRRQLVQKALFENFSDPIAFNADPESDYARRQVLVDLLLQEMGEFNPAASMRQQEDYLEKRIKSNLARTITVPKALAHLLIPCPPFGNNAFPSASVKTNLNKILSNKRFGDPGQNRPLKEYIQVLVNAISGSYTAEAAYDLLLFVTSNKVRDYVKLQFERNVKFAQTWIQLQLAYSPKFSAEEISTKINNLIKTRPVNPNQAIIELVTLIGQKHAHLDPKTRDILSTHDQKEFTFLLLAKWFPSYYPQIRKSFENIEAEALNNGEQMQNPDLILNTLIVENIRNAAPISVRQAQMNALMASSVNDDENKEIMNLDAISEQFQQNTSNQSLALTMDQTHDSNVHIEAMNTRPQGNRPGQNRFNGAQPKTNRIQISKFMYGKCWLCGSSSHRKGQCDKFDPSTPLSTQCNLCYGYHGNLKCFHHRANVHEFEAQHESAQDLDQRAITYEQQHFQNQE